MSDKYLKDLSDEEQKLDVEQMYKLCDMRWQVHSDSKERMIKYLFIINTGGIAVLLAYMHNIKKFDVWLIIWFSLGVLFSFFLVSIEFFINRANLRDLAEDTHKYIDNSIKRSEIRIFKKNTGYLIKIYESLIYASILASFIGILYGLIFFYFTEKIL